jgi:hypothetical protein
VLQSQVFSEPLLFLYLLLVFIFIIDFIKNLGSIYFHNYFKYLGCGILKSNEIYIYIYIYIYIKEQKIMTIYFFIIIIKYSKSSTVKFELQ